MKHLLTAIACFFALSMSAQESLPWNPNANNDNIIGTVDLLAMLNVYGEEYSVQTCFKGDLCVYNANGSNPNNSEPNCGTIIGRTWSFNSGYLNTIHLTNEGYSQGDVIHVYHHKDNCNNETLRIKTFLNGNWTTCWVSYSCSLPTQSSLIFNGEYWEELE